MIAVEDMVLAMVVALLLMVVAAMVPKEDMVNSSQFIFLHGICFCLENILDV